MLFKNKQCSKCGNYYDQCFEECPLCHTLDGDFKLRNIPKNIVWLSQWQQILLFIVGFAYGGLLFFELLLAPFVLNVTTDETFANVLLAFLSYLFLLISLILIISPRFKDFLKHFKGYEKYLYGVGYAATLFALSTIIGLISQYGFGAGQSANQDIVDSVIDCNPLIAFLIIGIIGPICEELTYRVGLYSFVRRLNKYAAIIISSILFALIHTDFQTDNFLNELINVPSYLCAGIVLSIAYEHKGPACSILAHALYNIISFLLII